MDDTEPDELRELAENDDLREIFSFYNGDVQILACYATIDKRCDPNRIYIVGEEGNGQEVSKYISLPDYPSSFDGIIFHHIDRTWSASEQGLQYIDRLILQEIHELCHWALTEEENNAIDAEAHSELWNMRLVEELEYIYGEELPHPTTGEK